MYAFLFLNLMLNLLLNVVLVSVLVMMVDVLMFFFIGRKKGDGINFSHYKQAMRMSVYRWVLVQKVMLCLVVEAFIIGVMRTLR
ncbi:MAG: hypothetical protein LBQ97_02790 [Fusobacteriaceae bacterium]|jgi:uncharacterized membrane protein|nr:hypothetical protein [Fusobacteriaceae bacterium]